ncbi:MAG: hypothetical protein AAB638_00715 [Patescibacteria group bacterium]
MKNLAASILLVFVTTLCFSQAKEADKNDSTVVVPISPADQADIAELQKQLEPLQKQLDPIQRQMDAINIQINTIIRLVLRHSDAAIEADQVKRLEYATDKLTVTTKQE